MTDSEIMQLAKKSGLALDPTRNMLINVRGQHAQLVNFARSIITAHEAHQKQAEAARLLYTNPSEDARDATRYRWLRDQGWDSDLAVIQEPLGIVVALEDFRSGDELDQAIDSAIAKEQAK